MTLLYRLTKPMHHGCYLGSCGTALRVENVVWLAVDDRGLLKNRRYIGEFRYRDVIIPDGIPAIVTQDLFERVQEKIAKNKKAPARHKAEDDYLLTTKLFWNSFCQGSVNSFAQIGFESLKIKS